MSDTKLPSMTDEETLREVERLKTVEARHKKLCLADLGGDGVWPCGCHHLITDSYGSFESIEWQYYC